MGTGWVCCGQQMCLRLASCGMAAVPSVLSEGMACEALGVAMALLGSSPLCPS